MPLDAKEHGRTSGIPFVTIADRVEVNVDLKAKHTLSPDRLSCRPVRRSEVRRTVTTVEPLYIYAIKARATKVKFGPFLPPNGALITLPRRQLELGCLRPGIDGDNHAEPGPAPTTHAAIGAEPGPAVGVC